MTGVVDRGAPRKIWKEVCQERHEGYGHEGGNETGPLCLEKYY